MSTRKAGYSGMGLNDAGIMDLRDYLSRPSKPGLSHFQAMQAYATISYLREELKNANAAIANGKGGAK